MSILTANRSQSIWGADAAEFRPERWLGEGRETHGGTNNRLASSITFLFGPRSCIGQSFARAEMKCLIAAMVGKFKIEMLHPDQQVVVAGAVSLILSPPCPDMLCLANTLYTVSSRSSL